MVSQPGVAGWLAGLVVGQPLVGLAVGIVLQAVWGRAFALGAATFPLVGPATVAAAALCGWAARDGATALGAVAVPDAAPLAVALVVAFILAEIGRRLVPRIRRRRSRLMRLAALAARSGRGDALVLINLRGVAQAAWLGAGLTAAGLLAGWPAAAGAAALPSADGRWVALPVLGAGLGLSVTLVQRGRRAWLWWGTVLGAALLGWAL